MIRSLGIIIFSLFLFSACSPNLNDCAAIDSRIPAVDIRIQNKAGKSLIGEENTYKPSEITLTRGEQNILLIFNENKEGTYITLYYPEMESEKDYLLKLNDTETDILNLKFKNLAGRCFDFLTVETFNLNNQKIKLDSVSNSYIIQK